MLLPPDIKISGGFLIVDDRVEVLRALERLFALYFDPVYCAVTPSQAESRLRQEQPRFLLCDYWLGEGYPPATGFLPRWRKEFPCLQRVALMSGTNSASIPACDAVDVVFEKPLDSERVVKFFVA